MKNFLKCLAPVLIALVLLSACGSSNTGTIVPTPTATHGLGFITPTTSVQPTSTVAPAPSAVTTVTPGATPNWGVQTKTSGCIGYGPNMQLADTGCTPGDIFKTATMAIVCVSGYTRTVRNVPQSEKDMVYASYGVKTHVPGEFEVDHYVPLELGGSNDISNLWPQPAQPTPGFHQKDAVENYLHGGMCAGKISILQAQIDIATNWLTVYNAMPEACKQPYPAHGCAYTTDSLGNGQ